MRSYFQLGFSFHPGCESDSETIEPLTEVQTSYSQISTGLNNYISWFSKIKGKLRNESREKFEAHQNEVLISVKQLYERKGRQLPGQRANIPGKKETSTTQYTRNDVENDQDRWIDTLSKMAENENDCFEGQVGVKKRPLKNRWCDLMLDLFIDVQRHELIPTKRLSKFLNEENKGRIISSYFLDRYPSFDETAVYLNFNLKLTLQENPFNKPLSIFCKLLDENVWEFVEFDYLESWIKGLARRPLTSPSFSALAKEFLQVAPLATQPISASTVLDERMSEYFMKLLLFTVSSNQHVSDSSSVLLIDSKLGLDILSFILRYRKETISSELLKEIRESSLFIYLRVLEESIRLFSLFNYYVYFRGKEIHGNIKEEELVQTSALSSRSISRFDRPPRLSEKIKQKLLGDKYLAGCYKNLRISKSYFTRGLHDFEDSWDYEYPTPIVDMSDIIHSPLRDVLSKKLGLVDEIGKEIDSQARALLGEVMKIEAVISIWPAHRFPRFVENLYSSCVLLASSCERTHSDIIQKRSTSFQLKQKGF